MTSDDHENATDSGSDTSGDHPQADNHYEPSYSEPSFATSSNEIDWDVPINDADSTGGDTAHATAPDASALMDDQARSGESPGAEFWNEGAPISGAAPASEQVPPPPSSQQGFGQQPPAGQDQYGQQGYAQPGAGTPPQYYGGGHMAMGPGFNNPNYLVGPNEQGRSTLQLDYWLSVFFSWIPSLIFFLTERDKNKLVDEHTKELLNFNITRIIVGAFAAVPFVGWIVGGIASIVLFVMAILGAVRGPEEYANGRTYQFPLTFRFIK